MLRHGYIGGAPTKYTINGSMVDHFLTSRCDLDLESEEADDSDRRGRRADDEICCREK